MEFAPRIAAGGNLVVLSYHYGLAAHEAASGQLLWEETLAEGGTSILPRVLDVHGGRVFVGGLIFRQSDGLSRWLVRAYDAK